MNTTIRHRALLVVLGGVLTQPFSAQALDFSDLSTVVNLRCVSFTVLGPCYCNLYTPCLLVQYWEPGWLVETVKIPGTTSLDSVAPLMQSVFQALGVPPFGGGGAGNATGSGHTNLQYNEAHVVTFPQMFGGPCTGCSGGQSSLTVHYASEVDPLWRTATGPPGWRDLLGLGQLGVWAPLYPRGGKAIHSSEPVGSGIAAARAMDIAYRPTGSATSPEYRVVLEQTRGTSRCCQLGLPRVTDCMPVGTNPARWERRTVSANGTYLWLFWRRRTCCVDASEAFCGIALVGGHGANQCLAQPPDAPR
jgi:hypothetical protein